MRKHYLLGMYIIQTIKEWLQREEFIARQIDETIIEMQATQKWMLVVGTAPNGPARPIGLEEFIRT